MRQPRERRASPKASRPELVLLTREARQHRQRAEPAAPTAREAQQPPAEDAGGEVLLGNRGLAARPAFSEVVQIWENDLGEDRVDGRHGEYSVDDRLRPGLVEVVEGVGELLPHYPWCKRGGARLLAKRRARRQRRRLGGGEAFGEMLLHRSDSLQIGRRVEAQPPGGARRVK